MILVSDMVDKQPVPRMLRPMIAAALFAAFAWPAEASAHAVIVDANPAVGGAVSMGDLDIRLQFNSRIDRERSRLALQNPDRRPVSVVAVTDAPNVLAGRARIDRPGQWTLHWQVLSRDGHITRGDIPFVARSR